MVDVLEEKKVSWATYQENMPTDGFGGFRYICIDSHGPNQLT